MIKERFKSQGRSRGKRKESRKPVANKTTGNKKEKKKMQQERKKSKIDEIDPKGCSDSVSISLAPSPSSKCLVSKAAAAEQLNSDTRILVFLVCIFAFYAVVAYLIHLSVETRDAKEEDSSGDDNVYFVAPMSHHRERAAVDK